MQDLAAAPVTSSRSQRRRRLWLEWSALALLLGVFVIVAGSDDWFERLDTAFYDSALRLWQRPATPNVVLVAIDDESLRQLGRWPWPRAVHATLLPHLAAARGVFLDLLLSEPEPVADSDALLARALREHGRVVLPLHSVPDAESSWRAVPPIPELARAARAIGHIHLDTDGDGLVRRVHLREGPAGRLWPHAALALWQLPPRSAGAPPANASDRGPPVDAGPWSKAGEFPLAYAGPPGHYTRLSYVAVLRGDVPAQFFSDKFVLVGATATGLGDFFSTPVNAEGRLMPGVEFSAHVLQQLQEGVALQPRPAFAAIVLGLVAVLLAMIANALLSPRARLVATAALALLLVALAALLLRAGSVWIPPAAAMIAVVLAYPLWSWRRLEAAQGFLDGELERLRVALHRRGALPRAAVGDPLEQRIAAIEAADAELQRNLRAREEAISFLSHDMRAPQVSIIALADLYRSTRAGHVDDAFWQRLDAHARSTLSLAEDFVQITRAEHLDASAASPLNLPDLATEAIEDAWSRLRAKDLRVEYRIPEEAWIRADRALLSRALRNLIDNAQKHAPESSALAIGIEPQGGMWRLRLDDQGSGVPDDRKLAIFRRFEIGGDRPEVAGKAGAGLGLALVRAAAEQCGGSAAVEDAPGGGARFVLLLPACPAPA